MDQKIKTATGKIPFYLLPFKALKGMCRVFAYGARKYVLGNWLTADDAEIANRYIGGLLRHIGDCQRPDGYFDWKSIAAGIDVESGLPHIDHAICGLVMLRGLAIKHGVLPEDPGEGFDPKGTAAMHDRMLAAKRVADGAFDVVQPNGLRTIDTYDTELPTNAINIQRHRDGRITYQIRVIK